MLHRRRTSARFRASIALSETGDRLKNRWVLRVRLPVTLLRPAELSSEHSTKCLAREVAAYGDEATLDFVSQEEVALSSGDGYAGIADAANLRPPELG